MAVIYLMKWNKQGKFYVGQTKKYVNRKSRHICSMRNGNHCNSNVQAMYKKHGDPSFYIIEECENEELDQREQFYLDLLLNDPGCLNVLSKPGSYWQGKHTKETIKKLKRPRTVEEKENMKIAARNRMTKVEQYSLDGQLIATFESLHEASRVTGCRYDCIRACVAGKNKTSHNYIWKKAGV